jgi:hypothetical protein
MQDCAGRPNSASCFDPDRLRQVELRLPTSYGRTRAGADARAKSWTLPRAPLHLRTMSSAFHKEPP